MVFRVYTLFLILLWTPSAFASLDFTEFLSVNLMTPSIQSSVNGPLSSSPQFGLGFGFSFGIEIFQRFFIEGGLVYSNRGFSVQSPSQPSINYFLPNVQLPILIRYWFTPQISGGLGWYFSHALGNIIGTQNGQRLIIGYTQQNWERDDYGLVASVRVRIPVSELIKIALEERFYMSLQNSDSSGQGTLTFYEFQTYAGVAIDL